MEGINPSTYLLKYDTILLLLVTDIVFNSIIDSFNTQSSIVVCTILQLTLRIVTIFILIIMLNHTFIFRYGLLSYLYQRLKYIVLLVPLSLIFLVVLRVFRITKFMHYTNTNNPLVDNYLVIAVWHNNSIYSYETIYIINGMLSLLYYVSVLHTCYQLGNPKLYKATPWINKQ